MVMAKDGAIARIKLRLGRLSAHQALALASIAEHSKAHAIELSIRSNVQLRGIEPKRWDEVVTALYEAGLGADNPDADDVRNVMVSPTAGIDTGQVCDVTGLGSDLLALLQAKESFHSLSPKFSLQVDGGENCAMISHPGDIWLSATNGGKAYAFGLASSPDCPALGIITTSMILPFINALLHQFLRCDVARMKQIPSLENFLKTVCENLPFAIEPASGWKRKASVPSAHLGLHRQLDNKHYIGAMPLLGRLAPQQLRELARLSNGELRLTPWQGVLLPHVGADQAGSIIRELRAIGLETSPQSAHAQLRACSGTTGCPSALADTQVDGKLLAERLENGYASVHLTGCSKSCAALAPLPYTLLARSMGRYDLYAQGMFQQNRAGPSRFGQLLATDITIDEAAHFLNARHR